MNIKVENDDQLFNIQFWSRKFREAAANLQSEGAPIDVDPIFVTAHIESLTSVADEMDAEIARYERENDAEPFESQGLDGETGNSTS